MAEMKQVLVPDIGNYKDVPVIEIMVKVGDTVKAEQSLLTLETDKATMDVPAPFDGVVKEVNVKVGDNISEGSLIFMLEAIGTAAVATPAPAAEPPPQPPFVEGGGEVSSVASIAPAQQAIVATPHFVKGGLGGGGLASHTPAPPYEASPGNSV